jgi:AbrB family transcriptional regulator (stage V sporulation protein T)
MNLEMYVTDRDNIISCPNIRKKNYLNKQISKYLEECITKRTKIIDEDNKKIQLTNDDLVEGSHLISPILANGDVIGLVILLSNRKLTEAEKHIVNIASQFLGKNVEE